MRLSPRNIHGLWVTSVAFGATYHSTFKEQIFAENVHEIDKEPAKTTKQKSCIIVVGTTGKC